MATSNRIGPPRPGPRPKLQSTEMMALDGNLEDRQAMYDMLESFIAEIRIKWGSESPLALLLSPQLMRWLAEQMEQHKVPNLYGIAEQYRAESVTATQQAQVLAKERGELEARLATLNQRHEEQRVRDRENVIAQRRTISTHLMAAASLLGERIEDFEALDALMATLITQANLVRRVVELRATVAEAWMAGQGLSPDDLREAINAISPDPTSVVKYVEQELDLWTRRRDALERHLPAIRNSVKEWQSIGSSDLREALGADAPAEEPTPKGREVVGEVHLTVKAPWPTPVAAAPVTPDIFDQPTNGVSAAFAGE